MKKYLVETYYTCTFKTVHTLNNLDDVELSKIDKRNDGEVEVIDVKLNNRKTKKIGGKKYRPGLAGPGWAGASSPLSSGIQKTVARMSSSPQRARRHGPHLFTTVPRGL